MTGNEIAHQIFRINMHTPIPDLSSIGVDSKAVMEDMRPQITSTLTGFWNASLFVSNGFSGVQSASAGNIQFQLNDADDKIPYKHVDIVYDVDVKSDPTWIEIGQIILLGAGVVITIAGILTANPVLIAVGIIITIASIFIVAYEIVHEIITSVPEGLGGAAILLVVGVGAGFFLWTSTGREAVKSATRKGVGKVRSSKTLGRMKAKAKRKLAEAWH